MDFFEHVEKTYTSNDHFIVRKTMISHQHLGYAMICHMFRHTHNGTHTHKLTIWACSHPLHRDDSQWPKDTPLIKKMVKTGSNWYSKSKLVKIVSVDNVLITIKFIPTCFSLVYPLFCAMCILPVVTIRYLDCFGLVRWGGHYNNWPGHEKEVKRCAASTSVGCHSPGWS